MLSPQIVVHIMGAQLEGITNRARPRVTGVHRGRHSRRVGHLCKRRDAGWIRASHEMEMWYPTVCGTLHGTVSASQIHRASLKDANWRCTSRHSRLRLYPDAPCRLRPHVAADHASSRSVGQCATQSGAKHGTPSSTTRPQRAVRVTTMHPRSHACTCFPVERRRRRRVASGSRTARRPVLRTARRTARHLRSRPRRDRFASDRAVQLRTPLLDTACSWHSTVFPRQEACL